MSKAEDSKIRRLSTCRSQTELMVTFENAERYTEFSIKML
jgi:hypothetical protein